MTALWVLGALCLTAMVRPAHAQDRGAPLEEATPTAPMASTASSAVQGQISLQWDQAQARLPLPSQQGLTAQAELRHTTRIGQGVGLHTTVTLQHNTAAQPGTASSSAWFNELLASLDAGAWQFSVGKKIVSWDVAYGFRPNDLVQQEVRRSLSEQTLQGRPVLMAEHFNADTAWSLVLVNLTQHSQASAGDEPALAARLYQRQGAADWYGFARLGAHTGLSLGTAAAWVASDALELHGSVRVLQRADASASNPLAPAQAHTQAVAGLTWTTPEQWSWLAEAWWDGSTRTHNLYARVSLDSGTWQPALDVLYQPGDGGRVWTAALHYQGDRLKVQTGLRTHSGPASARIAQLPLWQQVYVRGVWAF